MKKTIVTLACALIAPLAFAQTSSKGTRQGTTTAETITITGTMVTETTEEGAAASYQPVKTLGVHARQPLRARVLGNQTGSTGRPEFDQKISTDEYRSRIASAWVTQDSLVCIHRGGHRDYRTRVLESHSRTKKTCCEGESQ